MKKENKKCDWFKTPIPDGDEPAIVFINDKSYRVCETARLALLKVLDSPSAGMSDLLEKTAQPEKVPQSQDNLAASLLDIDVDSDGLSDNTPTEPADIDPDNIIKTVQQQADAAPAPPQPHNDAPVEIRLPDDPNARIPPQSEQTIKTIMDQAYKRPPGTLDALSPGAGSRAAYQRLQELNKKLSNEISSRAGNGINFNDNNNIGR